MTEKEAIAYIKAIKNGLHETGKDFPYRDEIIPVAKEALEMAIKALEQEHCGDCVSREYVIKLLENTKRTRKEITNRIYEVPSVTPQQKMGRWEWNQYDANPKIGNFHCSLCHSIGRTYFDYCPYCGAKMLEIPIGQIVANGEIYPGEFDDPFAEEGSEKK